MYIGYLLSASGLGNSHMFVVFFVHGFLCRIGLGGVGCVLVICCHGGRVLLPPSTSMLCLVGFIQGENGYGVRMAMIFKGLSQSCDVVRI